MIASVPFAAAGVATASGAGQWLPSTTGAAGMAAWVLVTTLIGLGFGVAVHRDALARDVPHARLWGLLVGVLFVGAILPGLAAVLAYRLRRRRAGARDRRVGGRPGEVP